MNSTRITKKNISKSYDRLILRAQLDLNFIALTLAAAAICFFGIKMNSTPVIIGAMVISPIFFPIISAGVASFKKDWKSFFCGIITLSIGLIAAVSIVVFINLFSGNEIELVNRLNYELLNYFFVAFFSGLVGTFMFFWPERNVEAIVGIAISVALIPPVVLIGVGLANIDYYLFIRSLIIVAINIFGIYLGSLIMFAGLNFLSGKNG